MLLFFVPNVDVSVRLSPFLEFGLMTRQSISESCVRLLAFKKLIKSSQINDVGI